MCGVHARVALRFVFLVRAHAMAGMKPSGKSPLWGERRQGAAVKMAPQQQLTAWILNGRLSRWMMGPCTTSTRSTRSSRRTCFVLSCAVLGWLALLRAPCVLPLGWVRVSRKPRFDARVCRAYVEFRQLGDASPFAGRLGDENH